MLVGGIVLLVLGAIITILEDFRRGGALLVCGALAFLPGSYSATILYGAYRGWKGYHYTQVPSYDDY